MALCPHRIAPSECLVTKLVALSAPLHPHTSPAPLHQNVCTHAHPCALMQVHVASYDVREVVRALVYRNLRHTTNQAEWLHAVDAAVSMMSN